MAVGGGGYALGGGDEQTRQVIEQIAVLGWLLVEQGGLILHLVHRAVVLLIILLPRLST